MMGKLRLRIGISVAAKLCGIAGLVEFVFFQESSDRSGLLRISQILKQFQKETIILIAGRILKIV